MPSSRWHAEWRNGPTLSSSWPTSRSPGGSSARLPTSCRPSSASPTRSASSASSQRLRRPTSSSFRMCLRLCRSCWRLSPSCRPRGSRCPISCSRPAPRRRRTRTSATLRSSARPSTRSCARVTPTGASRRPSRRTRKRTRTGWGSGSRRVGRGWRTWRTATSTPPSSRTCRGPPRARCASSSSRATARSRCSSPRSSSRRAR
mmetsp:Transcript_33224/g.106644  ORF Transcript_33224/g.106644 Transcript_33224/m.106644 type:complete len:203 (+) Transcript_33224:151-759(+)